MSVIARSWVISWGQGLKTSTISLVKVGGKTVRLASQFGGISPQRGYGENKGND